MNQGYKSAISCIARSNRFKKIASFSFSSALPILIQVIYPFSCVSRKLAKSTESSDPGQNLVANLYYAAVCIQTKLFSLGCSFLFSSARTPSKTLPMVHRKSLQCGMLLPTRCGASCRKLRYGLHTVIHFIYDPLRK